jgi:signal peptidase
MTDQERRRRTPAGVLGDVLLWVASIGGTICIIGVIVALGFHISLIMFKTGSMSPTIPTGSLAIVHEIPASEIHVGDVVTVDRPGQLPVTHRVTSVVGSGASRTITLRGDANPTDDIAPYVVTSVRIVWWSIPGWARIVVWFSDPLVLGGLTIGATALVTWAFWPHDPDRGRRRAPRRRAFRRASRRRGAAAATGVSVLAIALALVAAAPPRVARAAEIETVTSSADLTLTSIGDPVLMGAMTAFSSVPWQVGVQAHPPETGVVHIGVAAIGARPDPGEFTVEVQACPTRWVAGGCSTAPELWLPATDLAAAVVATNPIGARELGSMGSSDQRWLMLTVTMTAPGAAARAQLQLWAWGAGTALSTAPSSLAVTGAGGWFSPAMLAFGSVAAGLLLAAIPRRRIDRGNERV